MYPLGQTSPGEYTPHVESVPPNERVDAPEVRGGKHSESPMELPV